MIAVAVIVAAGKSTRFGESSKVLAPLLGRPVLAWTLDAFERSTLTTDVILVVGEHTQAPITELVAAGSWTKVRAIVRGGDSRQQSMVNGVQAGREDADVVLVHDAARPLVQPVLIDAAIETAHDHGGAILAAPVTDTIKRGWTGEVVETLDRSVLYAAQTPQAFTADRMANMVELAMNEPAQMTDEASLAELLGYPVIIVDSDSTNLKITHQHDVLVAEAILRARKESAL